VYTSTEEIKEIKARTRGGWEGGLEVKKDGGCQRGFRELPND